MTDCSKLSFLFVKLSTKVFVSVFVRVAGDIMLCGASPTCMFPHSGIPPSSWGRRLRPGPDWAHDIEKDTDMKTGQHACFPTLALSSNSNMLPSIYVRNGVLLLCLYLVQERGEDPPGLSQFIAGTGRRSILVPKIRHRTKNMVELENVSAHVTTNLRTKCIWFPQKTSRISLS